MRVISGRFKGRQLVRFQAAHIRPTTDRVKESLFNILTGRVEGARVLDLFSGTGSLAIECLSRGADWVDLVESHRKSVAIIRENLALLGLREGYKIFAVDVFKYLRDYVGPEYDVILCDPPFTKSWAHSLAQEIGAMDLLAPDGRLVIEAAAKERMEESYSGLIRLDQRSFGDKSLNFFGRTVSEE